MKEFLAITKALSDKSRVRAMMALAGGELCVCQMIELLGLAASTVSKHMAILHQAGLVETRKDGRWIYYHFPGKGAPPRVLQAIRWVRKCLERAPQVVKDAKRLKAIKKMSTEDLCKHYK